MKNKLILDPDADGKQWLYRDCIIMTSVVLSLPKYSMYYKDEGFIGFGDTLKYCKLFIDDYYQELKEKKFPGYTKVRTESGDTYIL